MPCSRIADRCQRAGGRISHHYGLTIRSSSYQYYAAEPHRICHIDLYDGADEAQQVLVEFRIRDRESRSDGAQHLVERDADLDRDAAVHEDSRERRGHAASHSF